jgi:hypothetical protein
MVKIKEMSSIKKNNKLRINLIEKFESSDKENNF